jgi:hypothetical protein
MESPYKKIQNLTKDIWLIEPLDGDQTENVAELFLLELNYQHGNITSKEYEQGINTLKKQLSWCF